MALSTTEILDKAIQNEKELHNKAVIENLERTIEQQKELQASNSLKKLEREAKTVHEQQEVSRRAFLLKRLAEEKRLAAEAEKALAEMQEKDRVAKLPKKTVYKITGVVF
jgi:hypothetical protein